MTTVGAFWRGPPTSQSNARSWNGTETRGSNKGGVWNGESYVHLNSCRATGCGLTPCSQHGATSLVRERGGGKEEGREEGGREERRERRKEGGREGGRE